MINKITLINLRTEIRVNILQAGPADRREKKSRVKKRGKEEKKGGKE
jgi:hypothetical protein